MAEATLAVCSRDPTRDNTASIARYYFATRRKRDLSTREESDKHVSSR